MLKILNWETKYSNRECTSVGLLNGKAVRLFLNIYFYTCMRICLWEVVVNTKTHNWTNVKYQ